MLNEDEWSGALSKYLCVFLNAAFDYKHFDLYFIQQNILYHRSISSLGDSDTILVPTVSSLKSLPTILHLINKGDVS